MHIAAQKGDLRLINAFLNTSHNLNLDQIDSFGSTALANACKLGLNYEKCAIALLKAGSNPFYTQTGNTPLHFVSYLGSSRLVKQFLTHKDYQDLDRRDKSGMTAL